MSKLIMWNMITLDGYFNGERNWDMDFHELVWGEELEAYSIELLKSSEMLIYGKTTYEGMADHWTKAEGEIADYMNELPKAVASRSLSASDWNNTTILRDAVAELSKLKQQGNGLMFVFGSGILSESLMKADLFDEYRLCLVPTFLGKGRRLFNDGLPYQKLKLLEARPLKTGGTILRYAPNTRK